MRINKLEIITFNEIQRKINHCKLEIFQIKKFNKLPIAISSINLNSNNLNNKK